MQCEVFNCEGFVELIRSREITIWLTLYIGFTVAYCLISRCAVKPLFGLSLGRPCCLGAPVRWGSHCGGLVKVLGYRWRVCRQACGRGGNRRAGIFTRSSSLVLARLHLVVLCIFFPQHGAISLFLNFCLVLYTA